jgi:catechol 2,3-dioxygenase-like lactoylglutathione lyase family enzyme
VNLNQVSLPARALEASVAFYRTLGLILIVKTDIYARFELPEGDATLSLFAADAIADGEGAHVYFECADLDRRVEDLTAKGIAFESRLEDMHWLWREARLKDPSGNPICLYWAGENRKSPPWRIASADRGSAQ